MAQFLITFSERGTRILIPASTSSSPSPSAIRLYQDYYQNQEPEIAEIENKIQNWSLPNIKYKEMYKTSTFKFRNQDTIHTIESSKSTENEYETVKSLNKDMLIR